MKNEYYQKLTELKKREPKRVELNKVEDTIKAAAKIGGKILSKEMDILGDADDIVKLANGYDEYIRQLKAYEKSAKELGIDKVAKDAAEAIKHYNNKIKQADKMLSAVKSAIKR
jgi:soluble cytochrome b562